MDRAKKDFIIDMVNKSHHAGKVYRLPQLSTLKAQVSKSQLKAWTSAFLALFNETEQVNVKHTMFLWRYEDDFEPNAVRNGVPGSSTDVKWLFSNSRLLKEDFTPQLTPNEMQIINKAETLDFPENHDDEDEPETPCKSCNSTHLGSCPSIIAVYDKVVQKITGNQFQTAQKLFEGGPDFPTKTRQNLTRMRKTMENFKSNMSNYINLDLLSQFEDGHYHSWTILLNAIHRVYKVEEAQENMSQLFHSIESIVSATDKSTETKMGNLRNVLRNIQIKGAENYFISRDHDHGREMQIADEHYSPQVNTLLTYILFRETIDKKKWDEVQLAFERKIESGWSYQKWHQTRPELYKIMDATQKATKTLGGAVCAINPEETRCRDEDGDEVATKVEQLQVEINQLRRNQWQNSNRYGSWNNQGYRREANRQQRGNWRPRQSSQSRNSKEQLCLHCTHHGGTAVYHDPNGSQCTYDKSGNKKGGQGFNNRVAMVDAENTFNDNTENDELRKYYEDRLSMLDDIPNDDE